MLPLAAALALVISAGMLVGLCLDVVEREFRRA